MNETPIEKGCTEDKTLEEIRERVKNTSDKMARDLEKILGPLRKHYEKSQARIRKDLREKFPDGLGEDEDDLVAIQMGSEAMILQMSKHARRSGHGQDGDE